MPKEDQLRGEIERAVAAALETSFAKMRSDLVEGISRRLSGADLGAPSSSGLLRKGIEAIQAGSTQVEILTSLLSAAGAFAPRAALLVLRSGDITAWRGCGFGSGPKSQVSDMQGIQVNSASPLISRALRGVTVSAPQSDFDADFLRRFEFPAADTSVYLLPLLIKEKLAAMLYADVGASSQSGASATLEPDALETLVRFAGVWLETVSARKSGAGADEAEARSSEIATPQAQASQASEVRPASAISSATSSASSGVTSAAADSGPEPSVSAPAAEAAPATASADEEVHRKAKRFAKLLVDEIKLYNPQKVEEGRKNGDLYRRLKDDIDKSSAVYEKRYGQSLAGSADYFRLELVRTLANNDPNLLGSEESS